MPLTSAQIAEYRAQFPITERYTYLNHAGVAPTSRRVKEAAEAWLHDLQHHGVMHEEAWEERAELARARFARLCGASPHEIAFCRNTSHGLSLVAEGLDWRPGDGVAVATEIEYPSNVYPWQHLASRGVVVKTIAAPDGAVTVDRVAPAITKKTRLVAVSSAQYSTGAVADLEAIGALCRERGVLLCVDGIQTLGAVRLDVKRAGVHFLSADSHKWLLGLCGIGGLFVDEAVIGQLRPVLVGWKSTKGAWDFDRASFELREDALKLEEGSPAYALLYGLEAALGLLEEVGLAAVEARVCGLVHHLATRLEALGCEVGPAPAHRRHILTFRHPAIDPTVLGAALRAAGVIVSVRRGRVRVSPHFYNVDADLDRVVEVVRSCPA